MLKVSSKSNPSSVAGAMAARLKTDGYVEADCVGAAAVNNGIKAVAITRGFMAPYGIDIICIPAFMDIEIDGETRTAIKLIIEPR